ncbi:MAG: GNAT family N-acetyltransferase [Candidatus Saccharibacteria bacterium]|nr:GNAT family N-acetyltransferase [Moraxellaceae bacterium]
MQATMLRSGPILRFMPKSALKSFKQKPPKKVPALKCEVVTDAQTIVEVQRFRARVFGAAYGIFFDQGTDIDRFDEFSIHVVVRDTKTNQIAACTRVVTPKAKEKLGRYYSELEFNLDEYLSGKDQVYEIGRTCVDETYRGGKALSVLWMGMVPLIVKELDAKYLIGTVSVNLGVKSQKIIATEGYIHDKAKSKKIVSLKAFNLKEYLLAENDEANFFERKDNEVSLKYRNKDVPSLIKKYRSVGAVFSKEAYFDQDFNCADYFVAVKVNKRLQLKLKLVCKIIDMKAKK